MNGKKTIEERLEIVERDQRNFRIIVLMLLFGGLCALMGAAFILLFLQI